MNINNVLERAYLRKLSREDDEIRRLLRAREYKNTNVRNIADKKKDIMINEAKRKVDLAVAPETQDIRDARRFIRTSDILDRNYLEDVQNFRQDLFDNRNKYDKEYEQMLKGYVTDIIPDYIPEEEEAVGEGRNPYALLEQKGHEGKFTAQFKARKPHLRHLKSLEEFAHYILAHPTEFNKISKQRANYYKNLIEKKGGMKSIKKFLGIHFLGKESRHFVDLINHYNSIKKKSMNENIKEYIRDIILNINLILTETRRLKEQNRPENKEIIKNGVDEINRLLERFEYALQELINDIRISRAPPIETQAVITPMAEVQTQTEYENQKMNEEDKDVGKDVGSGRLTKKMMKALRAYHKQVGGKISAKDFELMLQETYKSPNKRDKHIGDYYIDESLSTPENVVYHNPKTGETKVAYRGTEGTLKDWGNNALYAFGMHNTSNRYKRSNEIQKQVEQKYGTENLDVLGHSQSGAYAQEIGKNAKNVIVLNPAQHPLYTPKTSNATVVRSKGDAVSGLKYLNPLNWGKKKTADVEIKAETYNPITEHMPNILERLPEDTILGNGRKRKRRNKKLRNLCNCGMCAYCR